MRLLFTAAHWHGLAKLRLHIDPTLDVMDGVTTLLGRQFRAFQNVVCSAYETHELRREADARNRRQLKKGRKANDANADTVSLSKSAGTRNKRLKKTLNLHTYKYHSLGDYVATIRMYGTTDSYSTEPVECHPWG